MSAPQEACERVFTAMDALVEAIRVAIETDPEIEDPDACTSSAWLRADGVSVSFAQDRTNELTFVLQVPMDTIVAWAAQQEREQEAGA